jgi:clan AA aspartic protease (TIGR02281 family)
MGKMFAASVAIALMGGMAAPALADEMTCSITDQRGNSLVYSFYNDGPTVREISFSKNGAAQDWPPPYQPVWTVRDDPACQLRGFSSTRDPGWFLAVFTEMSPYAGHAVLAHGPVRMGDGACIVMNDPLPAPAPKPPPAQTIPTYAAPVNPVGPTEQARINPPQAAPPNPPPVPALGDAVPIASDAGHAKVMVILGGVGTFMLIDTGASVMSITTAIADQLIANGGATENGQTNITVADGSTKTERSIIVKNLTIGSHTVHDIEACVTDHAVMLLPFPVLNQVGRFTIDTKDNLLVFG